jgi:hypothetical protein
MASSSATNDAKLARFEVGDERGEERSPARRTARPDDRLYINVSSESNDLAGTGCGRAGSVGHCGLGRWDGRVEIDAEVVSHAVGQEGDPAGMRVDLCCPTLGTAPWLGWQQVGWRLHGTQSRKGVIDGSEPIAEFTPVIILFGNLIAGHEPKTPDEAPILEAGVGGKGLALLSIVHGQHVHNIVRERIGTESCAQTGDIVWFGGI